MDCYVSSIMKIEHLFLGLLLIYFSGCFTLADLPEVISSQEENFNNGGQLSIVPTKSSSFANSEDIVISLQPSDNQKNHMEYFNIHTQNYFTSSIISSELEQVSSTLMFEMNDDLTATSDLNYSLYATAGEALTESSLIITNDTGSSSKQIEILPSENLSLFSKNVLQEIDISGIINNSYAESNPSLIQNIRPSTSSSFQNNFKSFYSVQNSTVELQNINDYEIEHSLSSSFNDIIIISDFVYADNKYLITESSIIKDSFSSSIVNSQFEPVMEIHLTNNSLLNIDNFSNISSSKLEINPVSTFSSNIFEDISSFKSLIGIDLNLENSGSVEPMLDIILPSTILSTFESMNEMFSKIPSIGSIPSLEIYFENFTNIFTKVQMSTITQLKDDDDEQKQFNYSRSANNSLTDLLFDWKNNLNTSELMATNELSISNHSTDIQNYFKNYSGKVINHPKYTYHIHKHKISTSHYSLDIKPTSTIVERFDLEQPFIKSITPSDILLKNIYSIETNHFNIPVSITDETLSQNIFQSSSSSAQSISYISPSTTLELQTASIGQLNSLSWATSDILSQTPSFESYSPYSISPDRAPVLLNPIRYLTTSLGEIFHYTIPQDTFYDLEDGSTRYLQLYLYHVSGKPLLSNSWIKFNSSTQSIYGLPLPHSIYQNPQAFLLIAVDSLGQNVSDTFHVFVDALPAIRRPSHEFQLTLKGNFSNFISSIDNSLSLVNLIGSFFNDSKSTAVVITSIESGSIIVSYTNASLHLEFCPIASILHLHSLLVYSNGSITKKFKDFLSSEFILLNVTLKLEGICSLYATKPWVILPTETITNSYGLTLAIVLSVVFVCLFLFILTFVLIKLYRRKIQKHKEKSKHEVSVLRRNKAPVMLPEEIQMTDIGCRPQQPMLLDVDLLPQNYHYHQPNGNVVAAPRTPNSNLAPFRRTSSRKSWGARSLRKLKNSTLCIEKEKQVPVLPYNITL